MELGNWCHACACATVLSYTASLPVGWQRSLSSGPIDWNEPMQSVICVRLHYTVTIHLFVAPIYGHVFVKYYNSPKRCPATVPGQLLHWFKRILLPLLPGCWRRFIIIRVTTVLRSIQCKITKWRQTVSNLFLSPPKCCVLVTDSAHFRLIMDI